MKRVFRNGNITLLWAGQIISQSGDSIYQIALLWLALELTGSNALTGLIAMSSYLPAMLLALPAGYLADQFDRRGIMLLSDGLRAVLVLGIPVAAWAGWLTAPWLAVNALLLASLAALFLPARDAIIPQLVSRSELLRANSLIQTSWQLSMLLGPFLAGLLLSWTGLIHLFTADSALYILSFLAILLLRPRRASSEAGLPRASLRGGLSAVREGLVFTTRSRVLLPLLLITIADNLFIMGPAIVGVPVFVREVLAGQAGDYAMVQAAFAVGMLLGTGVLLLFGERLPKGRLLLWGMVLDGFTFIPYYFAGTLLQLELASVFHAFFIPFLVVSRTSLIQEVAPEKMRGRVFSLVSLAVVGMSALSSAFAGIALEFLSAPQLFALIGTVGGLCGVAGLIWARELRSYR